MALSGLPDGLKVVVPLDECFDAAYGLEIVEVEHARGGGLHARVPVGNAVLGPTGIVHGGLYCSIAEALAARGTILTVAAEGHTAVGMENDTRFLRPIVQGHVRSTARPLHRDDDIWFWDVEHRDDDGRLCAITHMTIAIR